MLNMRGRTKYKWDSLKQVLAEKVVYDDNNVRLWMSPDGSGAGLLFYAKQAQVRAGAMCWRGRCWAAAVDGAYQIQQQGLMRG
jgi:hypothetical protein